MEQILKARKKYTCDYCGTTIKKGELYKRIKNRNPDFDENDEQIGIYYYSGAFCLNFDKCSFSFYKNEYPKLSEEEIRKIMAEDDANAKLTIFK